MTLHTTALSLFASTIASGLGLAITASSITSPTANGVVLFGGMLLLLLGPAVFVGVGSQAVRGDRKMVKVVLGSFAAGLMSIWFWLGPAQTAVLTGACSFNNFGACEMVTAQGGFVGDVALSNEEFVIHKCEVQSVAKYCRLAAAQRLSNPWTFCPRLPTKDAFEVVEWCTTSGTEPGLLVARR